MLSLLKYLHHKAIKRPHRISMKSLILAERMGFEPMELNNPFACFRVVLTMFCIVFSIERYLSLMMVILVRRRF